ncbi:MAG: phage Gp37/Gp68 family protein [Treponema sp.]|jgi:protein gp37|nr:phage Gp37/Gp68 family protein [Treponema sp.]
MQKTKIEWCDYTWNPVTGCLHNCPYCYARKVAKRFGKNYIGPDAIFTLDKRDGFYPFGFAPTFHRYCLNGPQFIKTPKNIFVCSMADLFGRWVPDEWILRVFSACAEAPQHRYLFLTNNPSRYEKDIENILPNDRFWFGTTVTNEKTSYYFSNSHNTFLSIEPIQSDFNKALSLLFVNWVIVGAETGNRKGKVIPKREWIENIVNRCREQGIPVFLKSSLASTWGEPLIQEYPW